MSNLRSSLRQSVIEPLGRFYLRVTEAVWAPAGTLALRERRTKIVMVSGVGLFAVALMILFLFVLPAMQIGGTPSEAQPAGPPGPNPGSAPPPGPPSASSPPGPPGPGASAPGAPGVAPVAAAPAGAEQPPLELSRQNPFGAPGVAPGAPLKEFRTAKTKYGPDWSRLPITLRVGFVPPERPPHPPPAPSAEEIKRIEEGAGAGFRISSILWTQGSPLATYETPSGETGTVGPGEVVKGWRVVEIGRTYVILQNVRNPAATQRLALKTER